jgi:Protein of unknown function (DUF1161)
MQSRAGITSGWAVRLALRAKALLPAAWLALAAGAPAQANTCEQFRAKLAERIEASGVRGYALEVVPGNTPLPRGGKVVGTCEGGARKLVYRRWGAGAETAASAPSTATAPEATAAAPVRPSRPASTARVAAPVAAPVAASAAAEPAAKATVVAPVSTPALQAEPPATIASQPASPGPAHQSAAAPMTEPSPVSPPADGDPVLPEQAAGFLVEQWPWIGAALLLILAGWVWRSRFGAYDSSGLPRGPKL